MKCALVILLSVIFSCIPTKNSNLIYQENSEINLFAFVGKKVFVREFDPNPRVEPKWEVDSLTGETYGVKKAFVMDNAFKCTYQMIQPVFNIIQKDTIDFQAYDHYGRPAFENYGYILLYLSKNEEGQYYHQKYQFDPLIKRGNRFYGENGESLKTLFEARRNVFKERGVF